MARIYAVCRPVLTGKGFLLWLLFCLSALSVDGALGSSGALAASFAPSPSPSAFHSAEGLLIRAHGSHCEWRVGRDARVGYSHNHHHVEACQETTNSEKTLETHDRTDRRTGAHKTAGEQDHQRHRASSPDRSGNKADESKADERRTDRDRAAEDKPDEKEAALSTPAAEPRERPRCYPRGRRRANADCDDGPPPPYRRDSAEERIEDEGDGLERARCGMLCMWRRAKYGHCGVGCSYYQQRYESEGYAAWRRRHRRDDYYDGRGRDLLK